MQAAEHGADFPMANKLRESMTHDQMHDFAVGSESGKPEHVSLLKGDRHDIVASNVQSLKNSGQSEFDATRAALRASGASATKPAGHPNRHKNLGTFLHKKKSK